DDPVLRSSPGYWIARLKRAMTWFSDSASAKSALFLHVLRHPPHGRFRGVEITGSIDGDPFSHRSVGSIGLVWRHEHRPLAVLQSPDANALEPAGVHPRRRLGVSHVNRVVRIDRQPACPAEFAIFADVFPVLRQDLDAVVVAVGYDQPPLGV